MHSDSTKNLGEDVDLQQKRNTLTRRIHAWRLIQDAYTPGTTELCLVDVQPEDANLLLPLVLPRRLLVSVTAKKVRSIEQQLRQAQLEDALADVRHWRRALFEVAEFKKLNTRGELVCV